MKGSTTQGAPAARSRSFRVSSSLQNRPQKTCMRRPACAPRDASRRHASIDAFHQSGAPRAAPGADDHRGLARGESSRPRARVASRRSGLLGDEAGVGDANREIAGAREVLLQAREARIRVYQQRIEAIVQGRDHPTLPVPRRRRTRGGSAAGCRARSRRARQPDSQRAPRRSGRRSPAPSSHLLKG